MKKGPLSSKEKEYIETFYKVSSVKELASKMDRSTSIVEKFVGTLEPEPQPKKASAASNLLARNKDRGIVVMTEASSMESDKTRKRPEPPSRYRGMIHQIKGD